MGSGIKFNIFDSLLKLASDIIFHLLNLTVNLLFSLINPNKLRFPGDTCIYETREIHVEVFI